VISRFHAGPVGQRTPLLQRVHVFPRGAMCSLQRALLIWLVPLFLVVGVACAAVTYWANSRMTGEFMDSQMRQLGDSIASQPAHDVPRTASWDRIQSWGDYVVQVFAPQGFIEQSSWPLHGVPLQARAGFQNVTAEGRLWRLYTTAPGADGRQVQVLQSEKFRARVAAEHALATLVPVLILLPLATLLLWGVAGAMSRAVQEIGRQAAGQDEHSIRELPLDRVPAEIKPLVVSFNALLARLRDAFANQRRFVQDAAHELRTPFTAVALQLENVRRDLPPDACRESFAQLEAGVLRAQRLVDQMLRLSRQEAIAGEAAGGVDVHAQVRECIHALIALADQRAIDLGLVAPADLPASMSWPCAAAEFRTILDNLVENALRYTPAGGVVDVRIVRAAGGIAVEVVDSGPGIAPELMDRVFDRFFRVPGSAPGGSGLGLAIARSAATRAGLRVVLRNRDDASGLVARIERA
jgi:signal transduction histidine kinase